MRWIEQVQRLLWILTCHIFKHFPRNFRFFSKFFFSKNIAEKWVLIFKIVYLYLRWKPFYLWKVEETQLILVPFREILKWEKISNRKNTKLFSWISRLILEHRVRSLMYPMDTIHYPYPYIVWKKFLNVDFIHKLMQVTGVFGNDEKKNCPQIIIINGRRFIARLKRFDAKLLLKVFGFVVAIFLL